MTSILRLFNETPADMTSETQKWAANALDTSLFKLNSNNTKQNCLLAKRTEITDLDDLLAKKIKTQSTDISNASSDHQSPLSVEIFTDSNSEMVNSIQSVDSTEDQLMGQDTYCQVQQALDVLQSKMIAAQEALTATQIIVKEEFPSGPISIPSFPLLTSPTLTQMPVKEKKPQGGKNLNKKMEEEFEITYGTVEFPFLSISTPFSDINKFQNNMMSHSLNVPLLAQDLNTDLTGSGAITLDQISSALLALLASNSVEGLNGLDNSASLLTTRGETPGPEAENVVASKVSEVKKRHRADKGTKRMIKKEDSPKIKVEEKEEKKEKTKKKEIKKEKKVSKEGEKKKEEKVVKIKQLEEEEKKSLYALSLARRQSERRKNRWQETQGNIEAQSPTSKENFELMYRGNKKKGMIPVGTKYQVDVSNLVPTSGTNTRRKLKLKWNPSVHNEAELKTFFEDLKALFGCDINEEEGINLIVQNNVDLRTTLEHIKSDKAKYVEKLAVKSAN